MPKAIPTVSVDHPLSGCAKRLALFKRAADRIAARRAVVIAEALPLLRSGDSNSVQTPYGTVGARSGRKLIKVTDPVVIARIEEMEAKINKMKENAVAQGKAEVTYAADTVALTGSKIPA